MVSNLIYSSFEMKPKKFLVSVFLFAVLWALTFGFLANILFDLEEYELADESFLEFLFAILIVAPILETLIFQFAIQNLLRHISGHLSSSILITAIIFACAHLGVAIETAFIVAGFGLALGLTFEYFRSRYNYLAGFLAVTSFHFVWNGIIGFILWLSLFAVA